jgi:hypothetical protein
MELTNLTAISPIDGRYRKQVQHLDNYFSEFALIKYRVQVEVEYFITLCELPLPQLKGVDKNVFETLRNIYRNFSEADAQRIKDIESLTNHDVKAVEYFLKEEFDKMGGMDDYKEFIHFGLTSQDINNTSVPLSIKEALKQVYYPQIEELIAQLRTYAEEWTAIPMLAKTHGQPASPTRLGKEVMVFVYRLERQLATLKSCPLTAKFDGVGHIVVDELVGEVEHVACGELRLAVLVKLPVGAEQVSVSADYLLRLGVPHDELLVAVRAGVELVDVHRLAGAAARFAECYLAQSAYLAHHVRRVVCRDDVYLVVALVGHAELALGREFALEQLFAYRFNDWFFHLCVVFSCFLFFLGWLLGGFVGRKGKQPLTFVFMFNGGYEEALASRKFFDAIIESTNKWD